MGETIVKHEFPSDLGVRIRIGGTVCNTQSDVALYVQGSRPASAAVQGGGHSPNALTALPAEQ